MIKFLILNFNHVSQLQVKFTGKISEVSPSNLMDFPDPVPRILLNIYDVALI